ncbi:MAG: hypothetical protein KAG66_23555, partial [Methylococcales bacterium]|nr:hypothetical protein [Methylococcales bacterium]
MLTHLDTPSATTQHSALSTQHAYDADTLLQASRRIDWRFLLPSPELGQVGIVGGVPDDLRTALEM